MEDTFTIRTTLHMVRVYYPFTHVLDLFIFKTFNYDYIYWYIVMRSLQML